MSALVSRGGAGPRLAQSPPCVLVVDDEDALRTVLARELRKRGFDVVYAAGSGAEAVEMYCRSSARIGVVLMDVNMPGMSGPDALHAIRAVDPLVRCCFMTADARPEARSALRKAGGREVLTKPFASLAEVCETLRRLADGSHDDGWGTVGECDGFGSARRPHDEGD